MSLRTAVIAALVFASPALAQGVPSGADPQLEAERQKALEERREALEEYVPRGAGADPGPAQASGGVCFEIKELTVDGISALDPSQLGNLIKSYVPGCLDGAAIQAIMRALDGAYAEAGYITSKTYIPPQNIASGTLVLTVLEGTVEGLYLVDADGLDDSGRGKRLLKTAFPKVGDGIFQLRDVEQGLDQMNRLKSVEAKLRLQPGELPGGSNVIVQRLQEDTVRGYVKFNNQGSESTGKSTLNFALEADDLLGINDSWNASLSGTRNTNALSFGGSIPYGYSTVSVGWSYSEYLTPLTSLSELFGNTYSVDLGWKRMLARNSFSTTELSTELKKVTSSRYVNSAALTPQNLTTFNLGLSHIRQKSAAKHSFDVGLTVGLDALGADSDPSGISAAVPRAQFFKLDGGWLRQAKLENGNTWVSDLRFQYAPHSLYGTQQMSLGSKSTVRGYETSEAIGDSGIYLRNDYYFSLKPKTEAVGKIFEGFAPSTYFDVGVTYDNATKAKKYAAGVGAGATYSRNKVNISLDLAVPLIQSNRFEVGDPRFTFELVYKAF